MSTNQATDTTSQTSDCSAEQSAEVTVSDEQDNPAVDAVLKAIISDVLGIDNDQVSEFDADTGLFGHLPELDSMAVAGLLTEMEDRLDIIIEDDDVDGEMLETYGGLLDFAVAKVNEG